MNQPFLNFSAGVLPFQLATLYNLAKTAHAMRMADINLIFITKLFVIFQFLFKYSAVAIPSKTITIVPIRDNIIVLNSSFINLTIRAWAQRSGVKRRFLRPMARLVRQNIVYLQ